MRVEVIAADLLDAEQLDTVVQRLTDAARPVDMLVNSAGFGLTQRFELNDVHDEVRHLHLHVEVPLRLMHAAVRPMLQRGSGRIVTVASVAAFVPWGTYGACKAWLVSFSRWANGRYSGRGRDLHGGLPRLHPHRLPRADGSAARRGGRAGVDVARRAPCRRGVPAGRRAGQGTLGALVAVQGAARADACAAGAASRRRSAGKGPEVRRAEPASAPT